MVVSRKNSLLQKNRIARNLFSSPKQSVPVYSDLPQQPTVDNHLNDRVAERFFVKRTKRSYDLSVVSKRNAMALMTQSFRNSSAIIDQMMQRNGLTEKPVFFLGPKIPSSPEDRQTFATPKRYICEGCNAKLLSVSAYVKHLRKHKVNIRCSGCNRCFDHVLNKRRHELHCPKKHKLIF